jgi:hypothetical protein
LPHSSQKALSGGFAAPQEGQATVGTASAAGLESFIPQAPQKMASSSSSFPQDAQATLTVTPP